MCMGHLWYLANDMQFYLITPLIVYMYCRKRVVGYLSIGVLMTISALIVAILTHKYGLGSGPLTDPSGKYSDLIYFKPWGRIIPYLLGVILGFMYFEYKNYERFPEFHNKTSTKLFYELEVFFCYLIISFRTAKRRDLSCFLLALRLLFLWSLCSTMSTRMASGLWALL